MNLMNCKIAQSQTSILKFLKTLNQKSKFKSIFFSNQDGKSNQLEVLFLESVQEMNFTYLFQPTLAKEKLTEKVKILIG